MKSLKYIHIEHQLIGSLFLKISKNEKCKVSNMSCYITSNF